MMMAVSVSGATQLTSVNPFGMYISISEAGQHTVLTIPAGYGLWMVPHPPEIFSNNNPNSNAFNFVFTGEGTNAKVSPEYTKYYGKLTFEADGYAQTIVRGQNDFIPLTVPIDPTQPTVLYVETGGSMDLYWGGIFAFYDMKYRTRFQGDSMEANLGAVACPKNSMVIQGECYEYDYESGPMCSHWHQVQDKKSCCNPEKTDGCTSFNSSDSGNRKPKDLAIILTGVLMLVFGVVGYLFYRKWQNDNTPPAADHYVNMESPTV